MDKIEYDSFYKFIVSMGIGLVVIPIVGSYYLISNSYNIIVSEEKYNNLSVASKSFVDRKIFWISTIFNILPIIATVLISIGIILIIIGSIKWYNIQKEMDKTIVLGNDNLELDKKEKMKNLTPSEILEKVLVQIKEDNNTTQDSEKVDDTKDNTDKNKQTVEREIKERNSMDVHGIGKYIEIENKCLKWVEDKYKRDYIINQNVRIGVQEFDIIGISKSNNIDKLFEVKYWRNRSNIQETLKRLEQRGRDYEDNMKRNWCAELIIVTPEENFVNMNNLINTVISKNQVNDNINIVCISENELNNI